MLNILSVLVSKDVVSVCLYTAYDMQLNKKGYNKCLPQWLTHTLTHEKRPRLLAHFLQQWRIPLPRGNLSMTPMKMSLRFTAQCPRSHSPWLETISCCHCTKNEVFHWVSSSGFNILLVLVRSVLKTYMQVITGIYRLSR